MPPATLKLVTPEPQNRTDVCNITTPECAKRAYEDIADKVGGLRGTFSGNVTTNVVSERARQTLVEIARLALEAAEALS